MTTGRGKYKRVSALFAQGTELEMDEDLVIWVQVLNPFEQQDAKAAAQAAKARMVLALQEFGSDELVKYESYLLNLDRNGLVELIVDAKGGDTLVTITDELSSDPEWTERLSLMEEEEELIARPPQDEERKLLDQYSREYVAEVSSRMEYERKRLLAETSQLEDEQIHEEFKRLWIERRGGDRALEEYRLREHFYCARVCDGIRRPDGSYDHARCDHSVRVWETEEEVRHLPDEVRMLLDEAMQEVTMDPKERSDSASPETSSESSPPPSAAAASPPFTPTVKRRRPPGTS
jgi:hypothetical protein